MPPEMKTQEEYASTLPQLFEYKARAADGSKKSGQASARDEVELDQILERQGLTLSEAHVSKQATRQANYKFKHDQLVSFTTQLATLLEAGVPIVSGLRQLAARTKGSNAKGVIQTIVRHLEMGFSLSEAFEVHPRCFPEIYRAAVRAGEHSTQLPAVLSRQAKQLRWFKELRGSATQALIYPAILGLAVIGLVVVLLTFLLPNLTQLFPKDAELPWQTQYVLALSDWIRGNGITLSIGVVGLGISWAVALKYEKTRVFLSTVLLRIPRLGELLRMVATARFAATAGDLHQAGCDALLTLKVSGETCGSSALVAAFGRVHNRVRQGAGIAESCEKEPILDPLLVQLIGVGESSGDLDGCLRRLAVCYDEEVPIKVKWAMSFVEPLMLIVAASVVGFILMAAILPILDLYETIG